ncbi:MAG TPA: IS1595 family transposase [Xanthobacteraceae bacterium]|jgi:transposase-like protein|nr:IS1595 family transposase [Xanthobacteraceae bacterium]
MQITNPIYIFPEKARQHLERLLWPDGPFCPHCGNADERRITKLKGKSTRPGVYKCNECEKPFSVTVGTVFESSHIPLNKWLYAVHVLNSGKKGTSAHELHRELEISYKSAWFMCHRIREAMREGGLAPPMGSGGGAVEVDETFIGRIKGSKKRPGTSHKQAVLSLLDRDTKQVRTFHIDEAAASQIAPIVRQNILREARMMTDEARYYTVIGREVASHETVDHSKEEWARGEVHTNTLEGYFSVFKRGMKGVYQHCSEKHLYRYLAEFDFRYNNRAKLGVTDGERAAKALKGIRGKRLTYRISHSQGRPETPF